MSKQFTDILDVDFKTNDTTFRQVVVKLLWTIHYWPLGKELLEAITKKASSGFRLTTKLLIKKHNGAHNYKEFHGGGCLPSEHGQLLLDLNYFDRNDIEPTQRHVMQCNKTYVYLFHELVHFYHDLNGEFKKGGELNEEFRTVGLYKFSDEHFSENSFRKQIELDRRPCYIWKPEIHAGLYWEEKNTRAALGRPEQAALTRDSPECKFSIGVGGKR